MKRVLLPDRWKDENFEKSSKTFADRNFFEEMCRLKSMYCEKLTNDILASIKIWVVIMFSEFSSKESVHFH